MTAPAPALKTQREEMSTEEVVMLGAVDTLFYGQYWFPKAIRQKSPPFHKDILEIIEPADHRFASVMVFRDGAKTTLLRVFCSKRIAYGMSRTILFVSKTQSHATKSITWLKRAVMYNKPWAQNFGLMKGEKWSEEHIEIISTIDGTVTNVLAYGMTGQIRGVNLDDFRPDLIIVDDPCDEQNTGTHEQRTKTKELFFGTVANTLAPSTDMPDAKMVLLQTVLDPDDLISNTIKDKTWFSAVFGCFDEAGRSRWEERWPTTQLRKDKEAAIARNQLSLWMREKECTLISPESCSMKPEWLQYYDVEPEWSDLMFVAGIDPAPPMSEARLHKLTQDDRKDYHAMVVWGIHKVTNDRYLMEYILERNPDPDWIMMEFFRLLIKYRFRACGVETIGYQQMLANLLRKAMTARREYTTILEIPDRRKKFDRIVQDVGVLASNRKLFVKPTHAEFIEEFTRHPQTVNDHLMDATVFAFMAGDTQLISIFDGEMDSDKELAIPGEWRSCP